MFSMNIFRKFTLKSLIFSLLIGLNIVLFMGIFMASGSYHEYSDQHHYHVNRGLVSSWVGMSAIDKPVPFPLVRAPFLRKESYPIDKIIDLSIFTKYIIFIASPIFLFLMIMGITYNKSNDDFETAFTILIIPFVISAILLYFFWLPTV